MKTSFFTSFFHFTKSQRSGVFFLLLIVAALQSAYYFFDFKKSKSKDPQTTQWLSSELVKDTVSSYSRQYRSKMRPFNPNFITDFKGYQLGMTVQEIDRLLQFRKTNRFVNSAQEFQKVTGVSDSLLQKIAPYFKFPDWISNRHWRPSKQNYIRKNEVIALSDINEATAEDLKKVYGIGEALSSRIIKERNKFGVFVSMEQLQDVYGLSPEVIERLNAKYLVRSVAVTNRININKATLKELMQLPYFKYPIARSIVVFRSMNGPFQSVEDLTKISGFPIDRIGIIALYLEF